MPEGQTIAAHCFQPGPSVDRLTSSVGSRFAAAKALLVCVLFVVVHGGVRPTPAQPIPERGADRAEVDQPITSDTSESAAGPLQRPEGSDSDVGPGSGIETWREIADFAGRFLEEAGTEAATLALVIDGKLSYSRGFGSRASDGSTTRDDDRRETIHTASSFVLAQGTHPFVDLSLLQLVDLGFADLDAPLEGSSPERTEAAQSDVADSALVLRDLLQGQARVPSAVESTIFAIEDISGFGWNDYLHTFVFSPLGMGNTRLLGVGSGESKPHTSSRAISKEPGISTTGRDLARFLSIFLRDGRVGDRLLLSPTMIEEAFAAWSLEQGAPAGSWYPISIDRGPVDTIDDPIEGYLNEARHPEASSHLLLLPEAGLALVLLTSRPDGPFEPAHRLLIEEVARRSMALVTRDDELDDSAALFSSATDGAPAGNVDSDTEHSEAVSPRPTTWPEVHPTEKRWRWSIFAGCALLLVLAARQTKRWAWQGWPHRMAASRTSLGVGLAEVAVAVVTAELLLSRARRNMGDVSARELFHLHPTIVAALYVATAAVVVHAILGVLIRSERQRRAHHARSAPAESA